jgi:O-succinylbenzoate synthase
LGHYCFTFHEYSLPFRQPLVTHYGVWTVRNGIILQLKDEKGQQGWGEIAPLEMFGTESYGEALDFCRHLGSTICHKDIQTIPATLPCCQFGFASAWDELSFIPEKTNLNDAPFDIRHHSVLLPTGRQALHGWTPLWQRGYRTFKWKIGVDNLEEEWLVCHHLLSILPPTAKLRLDANGGLDWNGAQWWVNRLQSFHPNRVEYLEQPLPVDQIENLHQLDQQSPIPIALDESVASIHQLESIFAQGWQGIVVVKPAIMGYPRRLIQFCQQHRPDLVFSSVFETKVGRRSLQRIVIACRDNCRHHRSLGFGTDYWFT